MFIMNGKFYFCIIWNVWLESNRKMALALIYCKKTTRTKALFWQLWWKKELYVLSVTAVELFDLTQGHGEIWLTCMTTVFATEETALAAPPPLRTSDGDQSFTSLLPRVSLTWAGNLTDWPEERKMERFSSE